MPNFKNSRLAEDIKREMTAIIRELKDPRIAPMTSIVRVELSGDMSHCKIFVSCIEGLETAKQSVKGLESGEGFIKRELFHRLKMRKCPELKFIADDSIAHSAEINKMLKEI
ncbi:MAG: 30S ribosome-binding factor RbfA [Ruminococcus sp.]|jgi:ribosome-binding factor A|nr:30S ribosome-binding factor RbfA [Ruminococcus sp.]